MAEHSVSLTVQIGHVHALEVAIWKQTSQVADMEHGLWAAIASANAR
jgi:hypothetical protein